MCKKKKDKKKKYEIIKTVFTEQYKKTNGYSSETDFLKGTNLTISEILTNNKNTKLVNIQHIFDSRSGYVNEIFAVFCRTEKLRIETKKKDEDIHEPNQNN